MAFPKAQIKILVIGLSLKKDLVSLFKFIKNFHLDFSLQKNQLISIYYKFLLFSIIINFIHFIF